MAADYLLDEWPEGPLAHAANPTIPVFVVCAIAAHLQASREWSDRALRYDALFNAA